LLTKSAQKSGGLPTNRKENAENTPKLDSAIVYKIPMNQVPKKK
jgi:hypothetical protein